jgi:hypothetical protein
MPQVKQTTTYTAQTSAGAAATKIIPFRSSNRALINYINVTSDKAASKLSVYGGSVVTTTTADAATGQDKINVVSTTGFANSDIIVAQAVGGTPQVITLHSSTAIVSATQLQAAANLSTAIASGDSIFKMSLIASIPCGATTLIIPTIGPSQSDGSGVVASASGMPLYLSLDCTTNASLNVVNYYYEQN